MRNIVLILGGYGVFGGRLARMLIQDARFEVIVAGRSLTKAAAFCDQHGGRPLAVDARSDGFRKVLAETSPFVLIDASGPFQAYGDDPYRMAKAAIEAGAHYLDLSDDAVFTAQIAVLDDVAKDRGLVVLSGVSSVPALSSVVITELAMGLTDIHLVESAILPGNRAPRGPSVMRSILSQAGRPLKMWRGSRWVEMTGWSNCVRMGATAPGIAPLSGRWASLIGAPDLLLFPSRFRARSVIFRAGLELKLMHGGLTALSFPVRWRLLRSLEPLVDVLKWIADRLDCFGTDRGGMTVRVVGQGPEGDMVARRWSLTVDAGDGPSIPAIPAKVLCGMLADSAVEPGARACLAAFSLPEAVLALSALKVETGRDNKAVCVLFEEAVGQEAFRRLPAPVQDLHRLVDIRFWSGKADIMRGKGLLSRLAGAIAGFPPSGYEIPVEVFMQRSRQREKWTRKFGRHRFHSSLSRRRDGRAGITERFGLLSFDIDLSPSEAELRYPVSRGRFLGIPLPRFILPQSETREYVDETGRVCFDVSISLPMAGHVVRYSGWLRPDEADPAGGVTGP